MKTLEFHPFLKQFPMMSPQDRDALGADIEKNGQILAVITLDGKIIDGRNRYLAMIARRIEPRVKELTKWGGKDFVASMNYYRKHMTTKERAHIAALMSLDSPEGRRPSGSDELVTQSEAAKAMGVSVPSVKRAKAKLRGKKPSPPKESDNGQIVDAEGIPISEESMPWWNRMPEYDAALTKFRSLQLLINQLDENDPFWRDTGVGTMKAGIKSMIYGIEHGSMSHVCPYCKGTNIDRCDNCRNTGLMSDHTYNLVPDVQKHANAKPF